VHTVAPKWRGGEYGELTLLAQCYENALRLADACGAMTMAFPAIGCGVRQFPKAVAMRTAIDALRNGLRQCRRMRRIHLSFQDDEAFQIGRGILDEQGSVFRTGEYWNEDWKRLKIETTDYWVTILGMCHHHWALIAPRRRGCSIFFLNDAGGVFDQIDLPRRNQAAAALAHNGFVRWGPGTSEATFINLPMHHPHHVGHQPVYSDGKGWNG